MTSNVSNVQIVLLQQYAPSHIQYITFGFYSSSDEEKLRDYGWYTLLMGTLQLTHRLQSVARPTPKQAALHR